MGYKELIERLKTDAEWARGNEWESPICLRDDLEGAIAAIEALTAELADERHHHDRYVDFELAQAKELERVKEVGSIHYAGGCYCRECEQQGNDEECPMLSMMNYTDPDDFCSYGRRRKDGADG